MILSEKEKALLFDNLWRHHVAGVVIVSKDGKFLAANKGFCDIVEYTEVELKEFSFTHITHPEDLFSEMESTKQLSQGELTTFDINKKFITKTNKIVWVRVRVVIIKEGNKFKYFVQQVFPLSVQAQQDVENFERQVHIWLSLSQKFKKWLPWLVTSLMGIGIIVGEAIKQYYVQ